MRSFYYFRELSVQSNTKVQHSTIQLSSCIGCVSSQTIAVLELVADDVERTMPQVCTDVICMNILCHLYKQILTYRYTQAYFCQRSKDPKHSVETQNNMLYSVNFQLLQQLMFWLTLICLHSGNWTLV